MIFNRSKIKRADAAAPDLDMPRRVASGPAMQPSSDKNSGSESGKSKEKKSATPFFNEESNRDRYMDLARDKHNWQIAWRITAGLLAVSIAFNGKYMLDSKYIPYMVVVDKLGTVVSVGPADKANPIDVKRIERSEMIEWVENTRRVVSDQAAQKDYLRKSYARVEEGSKAKRELDDFIEKTKPFEMAAINTKEAEVKYALRRGDNTFEVEWTETLIAPNGEKLPAERWKGVFTYKLVVPQDDKAIRANGAGFYITDFQWSKTAN
jgi:type IV secretory pathway TrbF-like protein